MTNDNTYVKQLKELQTTTMYPNVARYIATLLDVIDDPSLSDDERKELIADIKDYSSVAKEITDARRRGSYVDMMNDLLTAYDLVCKFIL